MKIFNLVVLFLVLSVCSFAQAPTITAFPAGSATVAPFSGATGTTMTITGTNFTGATAVSFGGTPATSFSVVSSTSITAVVGAGSSGNVVVTTPGGTATRAGFTYLPLSRIITNFGGYWSSTTAAASGTVPDDTHKLLGFNYNSAFYSTGVNDGILTTNGVSFTAGNYRSLPVAAIIGSNPVSSSVYLAIASKADGNTATGSISGVSSATIKSVLTDGVRGLDLGTGVTNLPAGAIMTFNINSIDASKISDAEPDILITQIADPSVGNDNFQFVNASGTVVGNAVTQDMTVLTSFGNYKLDLFSLPASTAYNIATPSGVFSSNVTRGIRMVAFKLSDFGITAGNVANVKALKITPSGNSDYAFIAYNANSINIPPNISQNDASTTSTVCSSGTAVLSVIGSAASGGSLTYVWERSTNGGSTWATVTNGGNFSGATTTSLNITNPVDADKYRATVTESSSGYTNTSSVFTLAVSALSVGGTISGSATVCAGTNSAALTLGSRTGSILRWESSTDNFASATTIVNTTSNFTATDLSATTQYRAVVQSGVCATANSSSATVTVNTISAGGTVGGSASACTGTNSTTLTLSGHTGNVLGWESSVNSFASSASIANTTTNLTATNLSATTQYRAVVQNGVCASTTSSSATVTVNPATAGGTISGSASYCSSTNSTNFTLSGHTGSILRWESSVNSFSSSTTIANTTTSLTATNLSATTQYRAVVQSGVCVSANSATATVTVNAPSAGGSVAGGASVCSGTNSTSLTLSGYTGSVVKWQSSTDNFSSDINDITNATTSLTATNISATTKYRAVVQSGSCSSANSSSATVTALSGQWIGGSSGDWNNAANWCGGVPTASTNISIPASSTVHIQTDNGVVNSINIAAGATLVMTGSFNLRISNGGTFTNNGTFDASGSTGAVSFLGDGTVSGTTTFNNIDTYGALNFGTSSTINGEFTIQPGGSVTGNSPTYTCPGSTLTYNTGGVHARSLEWPSVSSGRGLPSNVKIKNNTDINFPAAGAGYVCNDLTIESGSSLHQNYSGASAPLTVGRNVVINGTLSLGNSPGDDITLAGNWTRNSGGVFNNNGLTVNFNGSSDAVITAPSSASRDANGGFGGETFYNININKTSASNVVSLGSNVTVTNELKVTKGIFDLVNSNVAIVSNSSTTAHVASVPAAGAVIRYGGAAGTGTGRFIIQRHLAIGSGSTSRRWRLLTSPVSSSGAPNINTAWQEGASNSDKNSPVDPSPGFGTTITKSMTYNAADGYDQGSTDNPSLYYYSGGAWTSLSSTKSGAITDKEGYMLFARGNRSIVVSTPAIGASPTILEPKGKINVGNISKTLITGYQVIGNPYASAIDFGKATFSSYIAGGTTYNNVTAAASGGVGITYYIFDPKTGGTSGVGKFISCSSNGDGTFAVTGNSSGLPTNGTIQSGTAFFISADNSGGTITFHEADKLTTSSTVGVASRGARTRVAPAYFTTNLFAGSGAGASLADGVINAFHGDYFNEVSAQDAGKISSFNTKEALSIARENKLLAVERRSVITANDTIFLNMANMNKTAYSFQFIAKNLAPSLTAFLEDKFTGVSKPVNITDTTVIGFDITADVSSSAADRFRIVFKQAGLLPLTIKSVQATKKNTMAEVKWSAENESDIKTYEVEKSTDGNTFIKANATAAKANNKAATYLWMDENTVTGNNFYRIKSIGTSGKTVYSTIVKVAFEKAGSSIVVTSNPVSGKTIGMQLKNIAAGSYSIQLINSSGQITSETNMQYDGGNAVQTIIPSVRLADGIYQLVLFNDNKSYTAQVLVAAK